VMEVAAATVLMATPLRKWMEATGVKLARSSIRAR